MPSVVPISGLLATVFAVCVVAQGGIGGEPASPLDAPRPPGIVTLPAKLPEGWTPPTSAPATQGGKYRREVVDQKPAPQPSNRPVIKPAANLPTHNPNKPSTQPALPSGTKPSTQPALIGNREGLAKPAPHPARPVRESPTPPPNFHKPQTLPGVTQKPQTHSAQPGFSGNRPTPTRPAPLPTKPNYANTQKPQNLPSQTGLNGNRQGLTKPAPLPAHARPVRETDRDEQKPQTLPALLGTQKPQTLPGIVDLERPQTLPAHVGTVRPQTIPAFVGTQRPQILVDPIPPNFGGLSPVERPARDTFTNTPTDQGNKPQTLPALVSPQRPEIQPAIGTLPAIGTQPVLTGNHEGLARPAPLPARFESP